MFFDPTTPNYMLGVQLVALYQCIIVTLRDECLGLILKLSYNF